MTVLRPILRRKCPCRRQPPRGPESADVRRRAKGPDAAARPRPHPGSRCRRRRRPGSARIDLGGQRAPPPRFVHEPGRGMHDRRRADRDEHVAAGGRDRPRADRRVAQRLTEPDDRRARQPAACGHRGGSDGSGTALVAPATVPGRPAPAASSDSSHSDPCSRTRPSRAGLMCRSSTFCVTTVQPARCDQRAMTSWPRWAGTATSVAPPRIPLPHQTWDRAGTPPASPDLRPELAPQPFGPAEGRYAAGGGNAGAGQDGQSRRPAAACAARSSSDIRLSPQLHRCRRARRGCR